MGTLPLQAEGIYIHCSDTTNDISAVYTMSRFSCHMTYIATQQFPGNSLA